jgi:hypothetical protein
MTPFYVTLNGHIQSGITLDGFRWAFATTYAEFWHPLTWLSLMFDYQLYGLNAGGYHMTNHPAFTKHTIAVPQKACELGNCTTLETAKGNGFCRRSDGNNSKNDYNW